MAWFRVPAAAVAMILALLASDVRAQMNPLRQLQLTATDIDLLTAAANRLYDAQQIGVEEAWSNPDSGNAGTAEILETFEREGLPCRRVEHVITIAGDAVPKRLVLATCRVADGRWLLV